jgi:pimeloyl-ACP methyl ester carboxylesterase
MAARLGAEAVPIPEAVHSPAVENPAPTADALIAFWLGVQRRATLSA